MIKKVMLSGHNGIPNRCESGSIAVIYAICNCIAHSGRQLVLEIKTRQINAALRFEGAMENH